MLDSSRLHAHLRRSRACRYGALEAPQPHRLFPVHCPIRLREQRHDGHGILRIKLHASDAQGEQGDFSRCIAGCDGILDSAQPMMAAAAVGRFVEDGKFIAAEPADDGVIARRIA
jgi:hypothetical protein